MIGAGQCDSGQGADQLGRYRCREPPCLAAVPGQGGRRCRLRDGQAGQGTLPGGDALAGQHAETERERLRARVQRGMPQVLVAGIQPAGGGDLAGIRAGARFSSRSAR